MRKKMEVGDKVYSVYGCDDFEIDEREILYIEDDIYCLNHKDNGLSYTTVMYHKNGDYFVGDGGTAFFYRTKKRAIQEAIKDVEKWIKGHQNSILKHKKLLKKLNKELKNDI